MATFNPNPAPQGGSGALGAVPGALGLPPSIYQQLQSSVPNYNALTGQAVGNIGNELSGNLSQGTQNLLQNKAASFGVNIGQPAGASGNTISTQNLLNSLGLTSEGLAHEGVADYGNLTGTLGGTMLNPAISSDVALQNAIDAAAPNPAAAESYAQSLFDKYLSQESNPAGGTTPANADTLTPVGGVLPKWAGGGVVPNLNAEA